MSKQLEMYEVVLDAFVMETVFVQASSKKEAIDIAMKESQYPDHELSVYEVRNDEGEV